MRNLAHSKLRSLLALLGVLVGTASVVAMVLGGELATHEALKQFKSLGTDLLAVSINPSTDTTLMTGRQNTIALNDVLPLAQADKGIRLLAPYTQVFHPVTYLGQPVNSLVLGVTDEFSSILHITMAQGRFVSLLDQANHFCVIGQQVYQTLKAMSYKNPLGQSIQIGRYFFTIIGVVSSWQENSFIYADINQSILIPIQASFAISQYAAINNVIMQLVPGADITAIETHVSGQMAAQYTNQQITYRSAKELIAKMKQESDILTIFLGLIGSISLLVGGIGVMNIMLVSVIERRREIGIRRAVGATKRHIIQLFLTESILLSVLGGAAGVVLGTLIAFIIAALSHWEFILYGWPIGAGFGVSVIVGVLSGAYPAWQAARLPPMEALRLE